MAEPLTITAVDDTWVNIDKPTTNYRGAWWNRVRFAKQRTLLRWAVGDIDSADVATVVLTGRVGSGWQAQTISFAPLLAPFTPGRVTWNNQPAAGSALTFSTTAKAGGGTFSFDLSGIDAPYGWRVTSDTTADKQYFLAAESGKASWEVTVTYAADTDDSVQLRPDGGGSAPSDATWAWDFGDQAEYRIDTFADDETDVVSWTSGWVASPLSQAKPVDLGWVPPASGTTVWWEVTCRTTEGDTSDPSPRAHFIVKPDPTMVVTSPTGPIAEVTPDVIATLSGDTVAQSRVIVTGQKRSDILFNPGVRPGSANLTIPLRNSRKQRILRVDRPGWFRIELWPTTPRATSIGRGPAVTTWIPVEWAAADAAVMAPSDLTITPVDDSGVRQVWRWKRTEAADRWEMAVDGKVFEVVNAADVIIDGTGFYTWTDNGEVPPLRPAMCTVRAIDAGKRSQKSAPYRLQRTVEAVWLLSDDPAVGDIHLSGTDVGGFSRSDARATYTALDGTQTSILYGHPGYVGSFEGYVESVHHGDDVWTMLDRVDALAESKVRTARLVWGSRSMAVEVFDVGWVPADSLLPNNLLHVVRFAFTQVD